MGKGYTNYVDSVNIMRYVASVNIGGAMEFLILNGNPDPSRKSWEEYLLRFAGALRAAGAEAGVRALRDMSYHYCTGCWTCWWTTPGLCAYKDDMAALYPDMVRADVIVWASPLVMGNVSALVKKAQDRMVPLIHPYIELVRGECHHRRRYSKDIDMGLIVETGEGDTQEDVSIVTRQHERFALNGRGELRFFSTTARRPEEVAHEALGA